MKRWLNILVFIVFSVSAFAQVDTRVVDSLQEVLATQEGREKVKTMLELTWDFYGSNEMKRLSHIILALENGVWKVYRVTDGDLFSYTNYFTSEW